MESIFLRPHALNHHPPSRFVARATAVTPLPDSVRNVPYVDSFFLRQLFHSKPAHLTRLPPRENNNPEPQPSLPSLQTLMSDYGHARH